jgi:hypothetical protein
MDVTVITVDVLFSAKLMLDAEVIIGKSFTAVTVMVAVT